MKSFKLSTFGAVAFILVCLGVLSVTSIPAVATIVTPTSNFAISHLLFSSTSPTITSGFGYSASEISSGSSVIATNGTGAFEITVSGTGATSGVLTMPTANTGWACNIFTEDSTASGVTKQVASTSSSVTIEQFTAGTASPLAWAATASKVHGTCAAY